MHEAPFVKNPKCDGPILGYDWIVIRQVYAVGVRPEVGAPERLRVDNHVLAETERGLVVLTLDDLEEAMASDPEVEPEYVPGWIDGRPGGRGHAVGAPELAA